MIRCGYVENFLHFFLHRNLSTRGFYLSTLRVYTYRLIFSSLSYLSTFLNSGANILSLYLFPIIFRGKLMQNPIITMFISLLPTPNLVFRS